MKYTVTENVKAKLGKTRVYNVECAIPTFPYTDRVNVWVYDGGRPQCTQCSGPLQAMLSTCCHARAVKRFLARATA